MNSGERAKKTAAGHKEGRRPRSPELEITPGSSHGGTGTSGIYPGNMTLTGMLETLKPHDHLCLIYESKEEWRAAAIPFLTIGLKQGEKCIYVVDTSTADEIRRYLGEEGVDTASVEKKGQLVILHEKDAYTREGSFDPDRMIALLISETEKAIAGGYPALRVTGEMTWMLRGCPGSEKLLEYEAKLNSDLFPHYPCLAICQYDRWKFDPEIIKGVIMTHPLLVRGNKVYHNFYYIPPHEFLNKKRAEMEAQFWLNAIERESRTRQELVESRERYVEMVESMSNAVAVYRAADEGQDFILVDFNRAGEKIEKINRDAVIGKSVLEVFPGVREFGLFEVFQRVWRTGKPERHPVTLYQDNRISGWRENYVYKLPGGEIVAVYEDVTEQKQAEAKLAESEAKYHSIFENSYDAILLTSPDGPILAANAAACRLFGRTEEEICQAGRAGLVDLSDPRLPVLLEQRRIYGETAGELTFIRRDGTRFPAEMTSKIFIDSDGNARTSMIIRDITERKAMEEALRHREEFLNNVIEHTPNPIWVSDAEGTIIRMNQALRDLLKVTDEEIIWKYNILKDKQVKEQGFLPLVRSVFEEGKTVRFTIDYDTEKEKTLKLAQTAHKVLEIVISAVKDSEGKVINAICQENDITERKQMEQALADSEIRYRRLFETAQDAILILDGDTGQIIDANPFIKDLLGYTQEELLGKKLWEIGELRDTLASKLSYQELQEKGYVRYEHLPLVSKDGRRIDVEVVANAYPVDHRRVIQCNIRDITDRKRAEEALRKSEERFSLALENIPDVIVIYGADMKIRYINSATTRITGRPPTDFIGKHEEEIWPPEVYQVYMPMLREAFSRREVRSLEADLFLSETGLRSLIITCVPLIDEKGEVREVMGITHDITESKKADAKLANEAMRRRILLEQSRDGIVILDQNGKVFESNYRFAQMLGYSPEEMPGLHLWDWDTQWEKEQLLEMVRTVDAAGDHFETYHRRKDGTTYAVEISTNGAVIAGQKLVFCICRDITERKKAEEALRESEEKFRMIAETSPDYIVQTDKTGNILYASPACRHIVGYEPQELVGHNYNDFIPPSSLATARSLLAGALKGMPIRNVETEILHKNGNAIAVEASIASHIVNGEVISLFGIIRDITERKRAEEDRQRTAKLESIGTLAGGIAHDFNNLLTGIMGNIGMARRYVEPKTKAAEMLEEAEKASIRAKDLTQQLLTFARGGEPVKKLFSVAGLVRESATFALRGSKVKPVFSLPDDLRAVEADAGQINQVIHNIVKNADEAMPEGGTIRLGASNIAVKEASPLPLAPGNYVEIEIKDSGVGISKEHLSHIFEPYFTTKQKGSGLGLATAYSIIQRHDGHVTVESKVGSGTTFHVYLPASKKRVAREKKEAAVQPALPGKYRILVMDDEAMIREMLASMLKLAGYEAELTADGAEAIEQYQKAKKAGKPFAAVIMDLTIPGGMGGKEAIQKLLEIDPEVKAIVSSGYATDPIMSEYEKYGFKAVVTKPYSVGQLEKALRNLLGKKKK